MATPEQDRAIGRIVGPLVGAGLVVLSVSMFKDFEVDPFHPYEAIENNGFAGLVGTAGVILAFVGTMAWGLKVPKSLMNAFVILVSITAIICVVMMMCGIWQDLADQAN